MGKVARIRFESSIATNVCHDGGMDPRTKILEAAAHLLAASPSGDISTRDVCVAAEVSAPAIYRYFGDKEGMLSATVDLGFERYLAPKRAAVPTPDPVQDLRDGWDNHVAFAIANPNLYKLMYSPVLKDRPRAAAEAHELLTEAVERAAAAGRLRVPVDVAAQMVMSANAGVALALLYRPTLNSDPLLSARVRDAVIDEVTGEPLPGANGPSLAQTARTLRAQLAECVPLSFTDTEAALLREWLQRLDRTPGYSAL